MSAKRQGAKPYDDLYREPGSGGSRTGMLIGAAVAVVAVIALVAVVVTSESGDEAPIDSIQETAAVVVEGDPLPPYPETAAGPVADPATDPAVGLTPPTLVGQDFEGNEVTIDPTDGTPKVVLFAAHWCPVCQEEIPLIQEWIDEGGLPEGTEVALVSTGARADGPEYPPSEWLSGIDWSTDVMLDNADQSAANVYGLPGYPYMVFVDGDGTVVQRASGAVPIEEFDGLVSSLA